MLASNQGLILRRLLIASSFFFAPLSASLAPAIAGEDTASLLEACGPEEKPCTTTVVTLDKAGATIATETRPAAAQAPQARARGSKITWRVANASGLNLYYRFYSFSRKYYWPAANRAFLLPNGARRVTPISCIRGEKVCYGAWVTNAPQNFYGVGSTGRASCVNCCYTCNGAVSQFYVFR